MLQKADMEQPQEQESPKGSHGKDGIQQRTALFMVDNEAVMK